MILHTDRNYNVVDTSASISYQQSGLGVKIGDVIHARDIFLDKAFRTESGRQAFYAATAEAVNEVYTFYQELEGEAFQDSLQDLWTSFQELAKDAGAIYKVGKMALVNCEILDEYLETFKL